MEHQIQQRERSPSLVKENLFIALGIILVFVSIIFLFVNKILAGLIYLISASIIIIFNSRKYKKFKMQHAISKVSIIWGSIVNWVIVVVGFIIMLIAIF